MRTRPDLTRIAITLIAAAVALAPAGASALPLLDGDLSLDRAPRPDLGAALAARVPSEGPSLDFDLLGEPPKPQAPAEDPALKRRRKMLNLHQGFGIGLLGLQLATTVVGQLNYDDKFGVDNTGRYKESHKLLAYADLAAFAVTGTLALLAPTDKGAKHSGLDRVTTHKIGMALATVGMVTAGVLGVQTARREGYLDQKDYGRAHLVVGYATLAAMGVAVGALVF